VIPPFGGLVGTATYTAADWQPLLPRLIFGQGVQVGKSAFRGNSVYRITPLQLGYWSWLQASEPAQANYVPA
jgi:hypothetical protein